MGCLHAWTAARRGDALLGHDEAISLLAAAGKSPRIDRYYERLGTPQVMPARDVRDLLRPTGDTHLADVRASLARHDKHPPLYFATLHLLQRAGLHSRMALRLLGSAALMAGALIADRLIWPGAPIGLRLLGFLLLTIPPPWINLAVELRHYAFVFLGTILSFAAIISFAERRASLRSNVILLSLAPAILLWTHWGTALWIGLCLIAALLLLRKSPPRARRALAGSILGALVLLLPLAILYWERLTQLAATKMQPLAVRPMLTATWEVLHGAGTAWCSLPTHWQASHANAIALVGVWAVCGWIILRRPRVDRILFGSGLLWLIAWTAWLAKGGIPAHAVTGKYVLPLALCPLVILMRTAAESVEADRRRRLACVLLSVATLTHGIGIWQIGTHQPDRRLVASIRAAECVLFDQPKRGYMLPVVAKMPPEATVLISPAEGVLANWAEFASHLPEDRLLWVEIDTVFDGRRGVSARALSDQLGSLYEDRKTLRQGPHRTITEFRRRVAPRGS
ncbi:MAG: hypothetical protein ACE5EQ_02090 [Phycisphaerae bacterium]